MPKYRRDDQGIIRIDDQLTSKDALWASTIFDSSPSSNTLPLPATQSTGTGANLPGFAADNSAHIKIFNASWTHVFNSTTLNELRAGYFRYNFANWSRRLPRWLRPPPLDSILCRRMPLPGPCLL